MLNKKKILLIQGGMGAERNVSLSTGGAFETALKELGHDYEIIDAQEDLPARLSNAKGDVALIALHGKYAEDGIVQSICEYLKLPYSGSGVLASALCMDKVLMFPRFSGHILPDRDVQKCWGIYGQGNETKIHFRV